MNAPKFNQKVKITVPKFQLLKHQREVSIRSLLVFILAFGLIGYLIFRTFAATINVATLQAENMNLPSTGAHIVSDTSASGGKYIALNQSGTAAGSVNFSSSVTSLRVTAMGKYCKGYPTMQATIDGVKILSASVKSSSWTNYSASFSTYKAGIHNIGISFTNDYYKAGVCDRNLYVDVTSFSGPMVTPAPTLSLSASPASITSGQSSTLTWNSTNATGCTAAGAWSGSRATSGSAVVTPTANSTYTLTCTGSGGAATATTSITVNVPTASCTVSSTLVNSCRPWLGGFASNYPQTSGGFKAQLNYQEQRIGRQVDMAHNYHPSGSNNLSTDDIALATRANTILYINWKPNSGTTWAATGSGTNSTANAGIDAMANSIKGVAPHRVMVALWGEAERYTSFSPTCGSGWPSYKTTASGYSTTDYVNMWHNVRNRFNAAGVTNVVWVMNYMGLSKWQCMQKDLWPGNSYVDWVMWDPYAGNSETFASSMGYLYNWMASNSDSNHDFNSKAWGLAEYGSYSTNQATVYSYYDSIKSAVDNNTYPKLKAYIEFDNVGTWDTRVLYNYKGDTATTGQLANDTIDNTEQNHYKNLADDPHFTDAFYK
jgi:hypothetical protein